MRTAASAIFADFKKSPFKFKLSSLNVANVYQSCKSNSNGPLFSPKGYTPSPAPKQKIKFSSCLKGEICKTDFNFY